MRHTRNVKAQTLITQTHFHMTQTSLQQLLIFVIALRVSMPFSRTNVFIDFLLSFVVG